MTKGREMTSVKKKKRNTKNIKKNSLSRKPERAAQAKNERPGGLKTQERAVQAKIRGIQKKEYIPGGLKTQKGGPGKSQGFVKK